MRLPPEIMLSAALVAGLTALYAAVATGAPPAASGFIGHGLGIVGFLSMLGGTFGYAWRKRRSGPGALQHWMRAHVVTGLVGPYVVLLHTAFDFRGIAGVTFVLMLVVAASGIAGRYIYTNVPKPPHHVVRAVAQHRQMMSAAEARLQPAVRPASTMQPLRQQHVRASLIRRRMAASWWLLHVPLAVAMLVLAVVHVLGALYYATLLQ